MSTKILSALAVSAVLGLASVSAQAIPAPASLLGSSAASVDADRTVALNDNTSKVAVTYGETVRFVAPDGQSFTVKFNGVRSAFDLNSLAPAGALNHRVTAYVSIVGSTLGS